MFVLAGTECRTSEGKRGFCLPPSKCKPSLFSEPTICEYSETGMKLCCSEGSSDNEETSTSESNTDEVSDRYFAFGSSFGHPQLFHEKRIKTFFVNDDVYKHRPHTSAGHEWSQNKPENHNYDTNHPRENPDRESGKISFVWNNEHQESTDSHKREHYRKRVSEISK